MVTTVTQANQDKINELSAKIKFVQNKLRDIKATKSSEVEAENTKYKNALKTISSNYKTQISNLEAEIASLQSQLEAVK